jgi:hypothetical protein
MLTNFLGPDGGWHDWLAAGLAVAYLGGFFAAIEFALAKLLFINLF